MISLSWSRLSDYNQCPRKFQLKYIEKAFKDDGEKSVHLIKGEQLHKQMENYVLARLGVGQMATGFSPEVAQTMPLVDQFFDAGYTVYPEAQVSASIQWKPLEWFDKNTMYRAIWDLIAIREGVFIGDYKSGKVYDYGSSYGQLHLSAVIGLHRFTDKPFIDVAYIYMEHKKLIKFRIIRDEAVRTDPKDIPMHPIQMHFEREFEKVQDEKTWAPKANEFCKWCPATKAQCVFSRKL